MKCPCKDCEHQGCGSYHDACKKYQKFRKEREKMYEFQEKERKIMDYVVMVQSYATRNTHRNTKQPFHMAQK